jgi:hypothetical protein
MSWSVPGSKGSPRADHDTLKDEQDFSFLKKAALFLYISFLSKASAEIPPFLPLKKGSEGGDLKRPFQKAKFIQK